MSNASHQHHSLVSQVAHPLLDWLVLVLDQVTVLAGCLPEASSKAIYVSLSATPGWLTGGVLFCLPYVLLLQTALSRGLARVRLVLAILVLARRCGLRQQLNGGFLSWLSTWLSVLSPLMWKALPTVAVRRSTYPFYVHAFPGSLLRPQYGFVFTWLPTVLAFMLSPRYERRAELCSLFG